LIGALFILGPLGVYKFTRRPNYLPTENLIVEASLPIESVAALGQLQPAGEVRKLAAPTSSFGGTPRIAALNVREGELIKRGQVLAVFDNRPQLLAELAGKQAHLKTLDIEIRMQRREVGRFDESARQGATAMVLLEGKKDELVKLQGRRELAIAEILVLEADLANSELITPIDGIVLQVHARVGERSGINGVLEVGASHSMEALIEVYESDIDRVKFKQLVTLFSENGGFEGNLRGQVIRISPQVRQRKVLSTDPTGDVDARIVEVLVRLEKSSADRVKQLTGMKVIARFEPK